MSKKAKANMREVFTFDTRDILKAQSGLSNLESKSNLILSRAINRSVNNVRKNMKQKVAERYYIKPTKVGETIKVARMASESNPNAQIRSVGRHLPLSSFRFGPRRNAHKIKHGKYSPRVYTAAVTAGTKRQKLDGPRKTFMQRVKNGNYISVRRVTEDPYEKKLEAVYGPAVPQMLKNQGILSFINREAEKMIRKRVIHEIDRMLK